MSNVDDGEKMVTGWKSKETEAPNSELDFGLKIQYDEAVYRKIMYWVHKSPYEISGLGNVIIDQETNTIKVVSAILLPQKNTGTTTDIEGADVAKAMYLMRNEPGALKLWWHSHVNMNVFWSGTDIATIKQLGGGGWFCATVFNKRNETKSAFCQKGPVRLLVPDIPTEVFVNPQLTTEWDTEYDKNVKVEERQYSFRSQWNYGKDEEKDEKGYLQKAFEEGKEEAQEDAKSLSKEDEEWETITQDNFSFRRKRNLVPVQKKGQMSLEELNKKLFNDELADNQSDVDFYKEQSSPFDSYTSKTKTDFNESELAQGELHEGELSPEDEMAVDEYIKRMRGED